MMWYLLEDEGEGLLKYSGEEKIKRNNIQYSIGYRDKDSDTVFTCMLTMWDYYRNVMVF